MVSNGGNAALVPVIGVKHAGVRNAYLGINPANKNLFLLNYGTGTITEGNVLAGLSKSSLVLSESGKVGIGTITPQSQLHVVNSQTGATNPLLVDVDNLGNFEANDIMFRGFGDSKGMSLYLFSANGTAAVPTNLALNESLGAFAFNGRVNNTTNYSLSGIRSIYKGDGTTGLSNLILQTSGADRMTITETGNIGIGTSTPSVKLEVNSTTAGISGIRLTQLAGAGSLATDALGNIVAGGSAVNTVTKSSGIATALADTFCTLGDLQFRYSSNAAAGTLEIRSNSLTPIVCLIYTLKKTAAAPVGTATVTSVAANINTGSFLPILIAGGLTANDSIEFELTTIGGIYNATLCLMGGTQVVLKVTK
jgi:hypothetical protein